MKSFLCIIPACEQEMLAYITIKAILAVKIESSRIRGKKEFGYFSVFIDNISSKCVCRVIASEDKSNINIYFPVLNRNVEALDIDEIKDYAKYMYSSLLQL